MHKIIFLLVLLLQGLFFSVKENHQTVKMETELGTIYLEVDSSSAPITAGNFLNLVERGVYTNAIFYRVVRPDNQPDNDVKIEVIQGGLFNSRLIRAHSPIAHETTNATGIQHTDGVISMARNEPGSASTEFFICIGDQPSLDFGGDRNPDGQGFAAFGRVAEGMDVVRKIQARPDSAQIIRDKVRILKMQVLR